MSSTGLDSYRWRVPDQDSDDALGERILEAALACFEEVGIRRTSMDDIARTAGVGRMTVFRRFGSKDRLAEVVLLRVVAQVTKRVQNHVQGRPRPRDRAHRGARHGRPRAASTTRCS